MFTTETPDENLYESHLMREFPSEIVKNFSHKSVKITRRVVVRANLDMKNVSCFGETFCFAMTRGEDGKIIVN